LLSQGRKRLEKARILKKCRGFFGLRQEASEKTKAMLRDANRESGKRVREKGKREANHVGRNEEGDREIKERYGELGPWELKSAWKVGIWPQKKPDCGNRKALGEKAVMF